MRNLALLLLLITVTIAEPSKARGASQCLQAYSSVQSVLGTAIQFTQALIGKRWAEDYKFEKYKEQLLELQEKDPDLTVQAYIQAKLAEKPIPAIIDINGVIRIIDNHHKMYALTKLYGREIDFEVSIRIVRDYSLNLTKPNNRPYWTARKMIKDMVENGYISGQGTRVLSIRWFNQLPTNILEMGDSPLRSLMSFVLLSFPFQLKGSYFEPHIQNQLGQRLVDLGIEPFSKDSFSQENIHRLRDEILQRPELSDFLKEQALPESGKYDDIIELLTPDPS